MSTSTNEEGNARLGTEAQMFARTKGSFRESLRRAMGVVGETADGRPKAITQISFSELSGVARSTLAKYLASGPDDDDSVNPDMRMLCRLAHALNVPPAYLLMRTEDWQRLAHAVAHLLSASRTDKVRQMASDTSTRNLKPAEQSLAGLEVAKAMDVMRPEVTMNVNSDADAALAREVEQLNARVRQGLLATCALPPLIEMNPEYRLALLFLCASIGANNN